MHRHKQMQCKFRERKMDSVSKCTSKLPLCTTCMPLGLIRMQRVGSYAENALIPCMAMAHFYSIHSSQKDTFAEDVESGDSNNGASTLLLQFRRG